MQNVFSDQPLEKRKQLVKAMIERMASAYGIKKSALHELLGCSAGLINNWSYHGRVPYDYLDACCIATGVSMDWLLYGKTPVQKLHSEDIDWLTAQHKKILQDGVEYGMITVQGGQTLERMVNKFKKDLWQGTSSIESNRIKSR